jgi:HEPN domain-containing protein
LLTQGIPPPKTHNIGILLDQLQKDLSIPQELEAARGLTDYAVSTRYPADLEPIEEEEHQSAIRLAEAALSWAAEIVETTS